MVDNATPIEAISLNFYSDNEKALDGITAIEQRLTALQKLVSKSFTFSIKITGAAGLSKLSDALNDVPAKNITKLERLSAALEKLSGVQIDPTVSRSVVSLSRALSRIETSKADKMSETYEKLGELSETGTLGGAGVIDSGFSEESLKTKYEKLSMFVDNSSDSFARFNRELQQTAMFATATARSLDMLYQSMGVTQFGGLLSAPQAVAGLLPAESTAGHQAMAQMAMDLQAIGDGMAKWEQVEPITAYFNSAEQAAGRLQTGIAEITKEVLTLNGTFTNPNVAGLLPAESLASQPFPQLARGTENPFEYNKTVIDAMANSASNATIKLEDLKSALYGFPKMASSSSIMPLAKTDVGMFPTMAQTPDFTARAGDQLSDVGIKMENLANSGEKVSRIRVIFDSVAEAARNLGSSLARVISVGKETSDTANRVRSIGKSADHANSKLGSLFRTIKRIAMYRMIRSAIRMVTEGFRTGIHNLYQWSKEFDKTKTFANNMDTLATSVLYLKNSMGALAGTIINAITPAITWIIDKLVDVMNWINLAIAKITNQPTYQVAKKVATSFDQTAKSANKASKAVKSYTLGIDELNIIEDKATSGGGGGSVGKSVAADMFETRRTDQDKLFNFGAEDGASFLQGIASSFEKADKYVFGEGGSSGFWQDLKEFSFDDPSTYGFIGVLSDPLTKFFENTARPLAESYEDTGFGAFLDKVKEDVISINGTHLEGTALEWSLFFPQIEDYKNTDKAKDVLETFLHTDMTKSDLLSSLEHFDITAYEFLNTIEEISGLDAANAFRDFLGISPKKSALVTAMESMSELGKSLFASDGTLLPVKDMNEIATTTTNGFINAISGAAKKENFMDAVVGAFSFGVDPLVTPQEAAEIAEKTTESMISAFTTTILDPTTQKRLEDEWKHDNPFSFASSRTDYLEYTLTGEKMKESLFSGLKLGLSDDSEEFALTVSSAIANAFGEEDLNFSDYIAQSISAGLKLSPQQAAEIALESTKVLTSVFSPDAAMNAINKSFESLSSFDDKTIEAIGERSAGSYTGGFTRYLQGYQPNFVGAVNKLLIAPTKNKKYKTQYTGAGNDIMRSIQLGIAASKGDFDAALLSAIEPAPIEKNKYNQVGNKIMGSVSSGIKGGKSKVTSAITDGLNAGVHVGGTKEMKNKFENIGVQMVKGIAKGVKDTQNEIDKVMKLLVQGAEAALKAGAKIKSPSRLFAQDGVYIVQGLNKGIEDEAYTTSAVVDKWLNSFSDVDVDIGSISMPSVGDIVDEVQGYIATTGAMTLKSDTETMQRYYEDTIIPILTGIATDAKRQADKSETTEVVMNTRAVATAIKRQNRANGYSFTGG